MLKIITATAVLALVSSAAFAYQVTGPVVAVNKNSITVQKGKDKWEIARGEANIPSDVKVGSKVTVEYSMTASKVEAKDAAKTADAKATAKSHDKLAPAAGKASAKTVAAPAAEEANPASN